MLKPRDATAATLRGSVRVARLFSDVVSPPVMFAVLGLALALKELPFWPGFAWAATYGLLVSLAPILFILYMLRTGRIAELHMTNTRERYLPYLVSVICSAAAFLIIILLDGPELLYCLTIFNIVQLVTLGFINIYWLISIHTAGVTAMALIVAFVFGPQSGLLLSPLVILVCWARFFLKRHTLAQILAGVGLGAISVLGLRLLQCFSW